MSIITYDNKISSPNGKVAWHEWNSGNGLKFDGVNDYVQATTPNLLFAANQPFSIFMILDIKLLSVFIPIMVGNLRNIISSSNSWFVAVNINEITFAIDVNSTIGIMANFPYTLNTGMICICFTKDSTKLASGINGYVNALKFVNRDIIKDSLNTSNYITDKCNLHGIDDYALSPFSYYDLKVFNKELNQAEITDLYLKQGQIVPSTAMSSLQLDMRFDEKSGIYAYDKSGNNYTGTLVNFGTTSDLGGGAHVDKYGRTITQY